MSPRLRLRTTLAALALVVLAPVVVGCQPADTKPDAKSVQKFETKTSPAPAQPQAGAQAPTAGPPTPATPTTAPMAGEPPTVTLVDAGAEPREPLRLKLAAGQSQAMTMTMKMAMEMQLAGSKIPKVSSPPMQMTMALAVKEVTAEGDIRSDFTLDKIEVLEDKDAPPEMVTQLKALLGTMQKLSGSSTVTPRGIVKAADFNLPADLNPMLRQQMDGMRQQVHQLSVPFPEEALGIGAKWTVTQHLEQNGMKLTQVATWELKERSGTVVKLASGVTQSAEPQDMNPPGMQAGAKARLESLTSSGQGQTEVDLAKLAPIKGSMDLSLAFSMTTETNGMKMPVSMNMDLNTEIVGQ